MQLDNDLWRFAINFYQQAEVEPLCLQLQEQFSLSINRLLFACWAAAEGYQLIDREWQNDEVESWRAEVTLPVRRLRYQIRDKKKVTPELDSLYQALRTSELKSEQVEISLLYSIVSQLPKGKVSRKLLAENLQAVIADDLKTSETLQQKLALLEQLAAKQIKLA